MNNPANIRFVKLADDGTERPIDANDHAIVHFPDHGLQITSRVISTKAMPQRELEALAKAYTLGGHSDWDLLEDYEYNVVIDRRFRKPAVNPNLFLDIPSDWLWTKTALVGDPSCAWGVFLDLGLVGYGSRGVQGFGLAVRRVGQ